MSPGLAAVIGLLIAGLLLGFVSLYGIFALLALPTPVLLAAVALRVFHGKHIASIALASVLAWIPGILMVRAGDVGSHSNPAGLFEAVLVGGPIVSLVVFCVALALRVPSKWTRHAFDFALVASILIGASSLGGELAQRRRIETQELPILVKRVYQAEISYSAGRRDKAFTCDAARLAPVSTPGWTISANRNRTNAWLNSPHYRVQVVCYEVPPRFRVETWYEDHNRLIGFFSACPCATVLISMDESGELIVTPVRAD